MSREPSFGKEKNTNQPLQSLSIIVVLVAIRGLYVLTKSEEVLEAEEVFEEEVIIEETSAFDGEF